MGFTRLQPMDWPQDALRVPDGFGSMPPVARNNVAIGNEFFALSATFDWPGSTAALTTRTSFLATPQDGDFVCTEIKAVSWESNPAGLGVTKDAQAFLAAVMTIVDARTGRSLIYAPPFIAPGAVSPTFPANSVPVNLFRTLPQSGTEVGFNYDGTTPVPSGFRTTSKLDQPYIFTRQGGIEVSVTNLFAAPVGIEFTLNLSFNGYKDYANASR